MQAPAEEGEVISQGLRGQAARLALDPVNHLLQREQGNVLKKWKDRVHTHKDATEWVNSAGRLLSSSTTTKALTTLTGLLPLGA